MVERGSVLCCSVTSVVTSGLHTKPSSHTHTHTHTHFKLTSVNNTSLSTLFSAEQKHVGDGLRGNNREKETNLKGIDFLILINTFPLLRAALRSDGSFCQSLYFRVFAVSRPVVEKQTPSFILQTAVTSHLIIIFCSVFVFLGELHHHHFELKLQDPGSDLFGRLLTNRTSAPAR